MDTQHNIYFQVLHTPDPHPIFFLQLRLSLFQQNNFTGDAV